MRFLKIFIPVLLLFSCTFESDKIYEVIVPEPDGSDIIINLNSAGDTVYFYDRALFNFSIEAQGREVLSYRVIVGNTIIESGGYTNNVSFYVYADQVGSGYHNLKIEYTTKSGTNSMAEAYGAETITVWRELVLDVDSEVHEINITGIDTVNGVLKVTWQKYKNRNFKRYIIVKSCATYTQDWNDCQWVEVSNASDTTWNDLNFVGGAARYRIILEAGNATLSTQHKIIDYPMQSTFAIIGNMITVKWNKPLMTNTIQKVSLSRGNETLKETTVLADTSFTEFYPFGLNIGGYTLTLHAENEVFSYKVPLLVTCFDEFPRFLDLTYVSSVDKYATVTFVDFVTRLSWFDADYSLAFEEERLANRIVSSSNGVHVYHSYSDIGGDEIYRVDPTTYSSDFALNLTSKFGQVFINAIWFNRAIADFFTVSNNNWIAIQTLGGNHVLDMSNESVLFSNSTKNLPIDISPEGNYLVNGNVLYQWSGNEFQTLHTFPTGVKWAAFREDAPDQLLMIYNNGYIRSYRVNDLNLLWEMQFSSELISNTLPHEIMYDPTSKRILIAKHLINTETPTSKALKYFGYASDLRLVNGRIFITSGLSVDVIFAESL